MLSSVAMLLLLAQKKVYFLCCFFPVNSFHRAPDFLLTNIDWAVSDFLPGYAPPDRQPHPFALLLSLRYASAHHSHSGLWPGRSLWLCMDMFMWKRNLFKNEKFGEKKGKKEEMDSICICMCLFVGTVGLQVHRRLSFFCCSPAYINSSLPVQ